MNKHLKVFAIVFTLALTVTAFQNCGADFNPDEYSGTLSSQGAPAPGTSTPPVAPTGLAPKITSTSTPGTVGYFSAATLGVVASGDGLSYQWYKDGALLGGANSSTYAIASAGDANKGTYSVVVSNQYGQVNSSGLALNVVRLPEQAGPPVIVSKTAKQVLPFFSDVAVPLSVTASGYGLRYSWVLIAPDYTSTIPGATTTTALPDTTNQIMTTRTSFSSGGTTFHYVNIGTYRVTVTNAFGESVSADILVEFEPFVINL
jgi:hypothetical protein